MIHRIINPEPVIHAVEFSQPGLLEILDVTSWVGDEDNIALSDEEGNIGLFELFYPGVYTGHYFFENARGAKARDLAKEMLSDMFANKGAISIRGLTPVQNRPARWMTRQLGFTSHGVVETNMGWCEMFTITLDEFFHRNNK